MTMRMRMKNLRKPAGFYGIVIQGTKGAEWQMLISRWSGAYHAEIVDCHALFVSANIHRKPVDQK